MFVFLGRYKGIIVLVCSCMASLVLSWLTVGAAHTTESYSLKYKLSPFLAPAHFCSSIVSSVWSGFVRVGSIAVSILQNPSENARLQDLESKVEYLKHQLDAERGRNRERLEELYEVCTNLAQGSGENTRTFRLVPAKVIAVEPTDWFRYLTINRGSSDGVEIDMAVITRSDPIVDAPNLIGAVVGKVVGVQSRSARVQLITDRLSVVAVTIGSQGDLVLLRGQPETENCVIDAIPSTARDMLELGNAVIVDERSSIFPPGMLVGSISSVEKGIHFCRIEVRPAFKFSTLREVMVVLDTER